MKPLPLNGVNLGGWLVLERWMTPALFEGSDAPDEQALMFEGDAAARIKRHRDTFITESDIAWLASHGITALRIPVGFWLFGDNPPYTGYIEYLDWAVDMADKYKLSIVIDLHRAPGFQDGHDNSLSNNQTGWFTSSAYRQQTLDVLERIARRYGQRQSVWGIGLLNEPKITNASRLFTTRRFYQKAYDRLTPHMRPGMTVIFQ